MLIGASGDSEKGSLAGAAYVFARTGSNWSQQSKLMASDAAALDKFGSALSISGDTIAVGASLANTPSADAGAAYVFVRNGTDWTQQQKIIALDSDVQDYFGAAIAVHGDRMVVGAWGVDVGLLVVAVDDGWMPQTEAHFRVLSPLGIERIIAVLNKFDAADAETIELAEADVREHLAGTRFEGADVARVSSKTGEGIAALKEIILQNIRKLPKAADSGKPYLFVDRVFTSKGCPLYTPPSPRDRTRPRMPSSA